MTTHSSLDAHRVTDAEHSRRMWALDAEERQNYAVALKGYDKPFSRQAAIQEQTDTLEAAAKFKRVIGHDDEAREYEALATEMRTALP